MFASPAYADWEKVHGNVNETNLYVDFDRIRKNNGYVYYWELTDFSKPTEIGILSYKVYRQGDCERVGFKNLSWSYHKQPMGNGSGETYTLPIPEWNYPSSNTLNAIILKRVCFEADFKFFND